MNYSLKTIAVSLSLAGKHSITGQTIRKQTHNKAPEMDKAVPLFERQYLTGSFYLYHSFSVIVAQPLSFTLAIRMENKHVI
jgi:hypothetical protein